MFNHVGKSPHVTVKDHVGVTTCDGAVAGRETGTQTSSTVESSDLDEKVLTTTPVRDTSSLVFWVES